MTLCLRAIQLEPFFTYTLVIQPFKKDVFSTHRKNFAYNRISTIARARHCKALFNCDSVPECDIEGPKYRGLHTYTFFHQSGNYTVILFKVK